MCMDESDDGERWKMLNIEDGYLNLFCNICKEIQRYWDSERIYYFEEMLVMAGVL